MINLSEDYVIKIEGKQNADEDENTVSLSTRGRFYHKNGNYYIVYKETEVTGYEGSTTTVKVEGEQKVSMLRHGEYASTMVVEKGKRHSSQYETGEGSLMLGVSAIAIKNKLTPRGGEISFSYDLDINSVDVSTNHIKITVREV